MSTILFGGPDYLQAAETRQANCVQVVMEADVRAGQGWSQPFGQGLQLMLEPVGSGWILRVLPQAGPRPAHDYAELATPPYQSITPLRISTDFSFRAQDAIGWNPRHFRFAASAEDYQRLLRAYEAYRSTRPPSASAQAELVKIVGHMPEGSLEILDARFTPGMADQTSAAAAVATHFLTTAHSLDMPPDGKATPLGEVNWLRFRIRLDLPATFHPASHVHVEKQVCHE